MVVVLIRYASRKRTKQAKMYMDSSVIGAFRDAGAPGPICPMLRYRNLTLA